MHPSSDEKTSLKLLQYSPPTEIPVSTPTEEYLSSLAMTMFDVLLHKRNFTSPLIHHWDPNITAEIEAMPSSAGREALLDNIRNLTMHYPGYHFDVLNSCSKVNERTGKANVWLLTMVTGLPDGVRREAANVLSFQRRDDVWYCTKHRAIRGLCSGMPSELDLEYSH